MKRRGFFKAALALAGLKALGAKLFPDKTQFVSDFVIGKEPHWIECDLTETGEPCDPEKPA